MNKSIGQLEPYATGVDDELWNSLQVVFDAMSIRDDDIEALRVADDIVYNHLKNVAVYS